MSILQTRLLTIGLRFEPRWKLNARVVLTFFPVPELVNLRGHMASGAIALKAGT